MLGWEDAAVPSAPACWGGTLCAACSGITTPEVSELPVLTGQSREGARGHSMCKGLETLRSRQQPWNSRQVRCSARCWPSACSDPGSGCKEVRLRCMACQAAAARVPCMTGRALQTREFKNANQSFDVSFLRGIMWSDIEQPGNAVQSGQHLGCGSGLLCLPHSLLLLLSGSCSLLGAFCMVSSGNRSSLTIFGSPRSLSTRFLCCHLPLPLLHAHKLKILVAVWTVPMSSTHVSAYWVELFSAHQVWAICV